jgi:hypothetical protein
MATFPTSQTPSDEASVKLAKERLQSLENENFKALSAVNNDIEYMSNTESLMPSTADIKVVEEVQDYLNTLIAGVGVNLEEKGMTAEKAALEKFYTFETPQNKFGTLPNRTSLLRPSSRFNTMFGGNFPSRPVTPRTTKHIVLPKV